MLFIGDKCYIDSKFIKPIFILISLIFEIIYFPFQLITNQLVILKLLIFDFRNFLDVMDNYVENKVSEVINDVNIEHAKEIDELIDAPTNKKGLMKTINIINLSPDDIHTIICKLTNSNKYEKDASVIIDRLKKILNKNNYGVTYE